MRRLMLVALALGLLGCHRTTDCRGTITGPHNEYHPDTVQLRCK